MTDPSQTPADHRSGDNPPGMPRWVKVSLIVAGVLLLLVVILKLTGVAGEHGPGRHQASTAAP